MDEDDILKLLSRPSSANTNSSKRKTRKKVTFSNAVLELGIDDGNNGHINEGSLHTHNNVSSSHNQQRIKIVSNEGEDSFLNKDNDSSNYNSRNKNVSSIESATNSNEDDIALPSFSRSKRVDQSYNTMGRINDISDLFSLNDK
jgi:hypothetical protein